MQFCQPDVAPCFVLPANRSLVGILLHNGLHHNASSYITLNMNFLLTANAIDTIYINKYLQLCNNVLTAWLAQMIELQSYVREIVDLNPGLTATQISLS
jgi:hypothetical protein